MSTEQAEPLAIASGETLRWTKSLAAYPAESFTLGYKIVGAGGVATAVVVTSGSDYSVEIAAASLAAGSYRLVGWVAQGEAKTVVYDSEIVVTANLIDAEGPTDTRTYWQQLLEAIKAVSLNRASIIQKSMTTPGAGSRSIEFLSGEDLYVWQKRCEREIAREKDAERVAQGKSRRKVLIKFT